MITDLPDLLEDLKKGEPVHYNGEVMTVKEVGLRYVVLVNEAGREYGMVKKTDVFRISQYTPLQEETEE